jgi:hypothetical protein
MRTLVHDAEPEVRRALVVAGLEQPGTVIVDLHAHLLAFLLDRQPGAPGVRMLGDVGQCLLHDPVHLELLRRR